MEILEFRELKRRADLTYKFNAKTGRHGWLRLTPAYSLKIVEDLIAERKNAKRILDPFCGTGTTALCAAYYGRESATMDVNPFLIWLSRAKTAQYSLEQIQSARESFRAALDLMRRNAAAPAPLPPIHNIQRWWGAKELEFLRVLKAAILQSSETDSAERDLLLVAFCRTLIKLSNAAFNHQSMSFKDGGQMRMELGLDFTGAFSEDFRFVVEGALQNPSGKAIVLLGDARNPAEAAEGEFDLVVTSPPYVNRMSYIRELRPYMYWLGFLQNGRDAGELDWSAIGGTWGIATSRLMEWESRGAFQSVLLSEAVENISRVENKNGALLSKYVAKYFEDMREHFNGLTRVLHPGAEVHYIVGNSSFYGRVVPVEKIYAETLESLGFSKIKIQPLRKRNSKKELVEFDVSAVWG